MEMVHLLWLETKCCYVRGQVSLYLDNEGGGKAFSPSWPGYKTTPSIHHSLLKTVPLRFIFKVHARNNLHVKVLSIQSNIGI